ncbi:hypothetical protein [Desulfonatronospira sp.]|uniref:hypothetical protein n=1 Tax=Desulfonatronospira sp. TaxID=1962951 RepID=UPI0025C3712A|nr:hypothetical protein [Desulfonatronospira sp.]
MEKQKVQEIKELQNKLKKQEELSRDYFTELKKLEEQLTKEQAKAGQEQISRLESKLRQKELALSREKNRARQERTVLVNKLDKLQKRYEVKVNFFTKRAIKRKKKKLFESIKESGFFDAQYYIEHNPDVKQSDMDPLTHYMNHGWKEGLNPSAKFNTNKYLEQNPDVSMDYINPLEHYVLYGQHENRPDPKGA